jgi:teichuronic acid biosynthesis glycosyltransferase TuaH
VTAGNAPRERDRRVVADTPSAGRPLMIWQAGVTWDDLAGTDRHLVTHLADHVDILWVDPPQSILRSARARQGRPLRTRTMWAHPHVTRLAIVGPPCPDRPGVDRLTNGLVRHLIRRTVTELGGEVAVVVGTSPHPSLTIVPGARRVYYATDDFTAGASLMGKRPNRFRRIEAARVREADVVGAVSSEIVDRLDPPAAPTFVLPNGCDIEHFAGVDAAPLPRDVALPGPIAGMVGQLSPRVDLDLLEAVADAGISLLLVGPHHPSFEPERVASLVARSNVVWVGRKAFEDLPSYLRVIDVGLTPYVPDDFNRASFPLKTLEYLSAGRPVVSTPLPAVSRLDVRWVRAAAGRADFVAAVREAFAADAQRDRTEIRAYAATHDWSVRARSFLDAVGLRDLARS